MQEMPDDWRYIITLRDGSKTPGQIETADNSKLIDTIDFKDREVLDVGAWDGHFSVVAMKRGARSVTCLDILIRPTLKFIKAHFEFDDMHLEHGSIYRYNPGKQFDVVLFYGVYYHLSDPVQSLINCFRLSRDVVAVEGLMHEDDVPSMVLLGPGEIAPGDNSNIFSLSGTMIKKLAATYGFEATHEVEGKADPRTQLGRRGTIVFRRKGPEMKPYANWSFPVAPIEL